ncbi:hypothetical protein QFC24_000060 [Naganishia onofrii]|uniref:Uncharacterized protein n=1 Tax=Naganishia onofrii TaxID=1851511 RepID=A0ACC2XUV3_9TREE|nr:hypothetical protein QFC24_000060 [Naganishia onofrii]
MSHHNPLNDLGLGAPIGGGSSTGTAANTFSTSNTSAGAPVGTNFGGNVGTGIPGQHEHHHHSHDANHVHDHTCGHNTSSTSGLTGSSGFTGSSSDRNTTSGDQGIGRGSGGPTAFESDASKVGEHRSTGEHRSVGDRLTGRDNNNDNNYGTTGSEHRSVGDKLTGRDNYDSTTGREHGSHGVMSGQGAATAAGLTGAGAGLTGHSHSHGDSHEGASHGLKSLHGQRDAFNETADVRTYLSLAFQRLSMAYHFLFNFAGGANTGAGLTGGHSHGQESVGSDLRDREAGIKAGLGAGHHDQSSAGVRSGLESGSGGLTSGSHSHHGGAAAAGVGAAAAAGAGGIALTGQRATKIDADGVIQDSVTGQTHFVDQGVSGYQQQNTSSGLGSSGLGAGATGAGLGAGAAGLASHQQGQGHGLTDKLKLSTGTSHTEGGPISELKQELEEHKSGHGADHPESKGPHGLVWHNGKYVHEREISGHGSTGVPLR